MASSTNKFSWTGIVASVVAAIIISFITSSFYNSQNIAVLEAKYNSFEKNMVTQLSSINDKLEKIVDNKTTDKNFKEFKDEIKKELDKLAEKVRQNELTLTEVKTEIKRLAFINNIDDGTLMKYIEQNYNLAIL